MKIKSLPAVLALSSALALGSVAGAQDGNTELKDLDQAVAAVSSGIDDISQCMATEAGLKKDLAQKKASLAAEFGRVPPEFDLLLAKKAARITKKHAECGQQYTTVDNMIGDLYFKIRAGSQTKATEKRRMQLDALKQRFIMVMPTRHLQKQKPKQQDQEEE